jgi:hypothetical protein
MFHFKSLFQRVAKPRGYTMHSDIKGGLGIMARGLAALGIEAEPPCTITTKKLLPIPLKDTTHNPAIRRGNRWPALTQLVFQDRVLLCINYENK